MRGASENGQGAPNSQNDAAFRSKTPAGSVTVLHSRGKLRCPSMRVPMCICPGLPVSPALGTKAFAGTPGLMCLTLQDVLNRKILLPALP